jgi:hypothetical protein
MTSKNIHTKADKVHWRRPNGLEPFPKVRNTLLETMGYRLKAWIIELVSPLLDQEVEDWESLPHAVISLLRKDIAHLSNILLGNELLRWPR